MKILVVDDSAYNRRVIIEMLLPLDFVTSVSSAVDGVDALHQAMKQKPDLILLDLEMPNMDGFTFLRLLRSHCSTPVIVVSGLRYVPNGEKAVRLGANGFVEKPSKSPSKKLFSVKDELVKSIRAVAVALPSCTVSGSGGIALKEKRDTANESTGVEAIVIGASTGGPKAVSRIVAMLADEMPFAVIVTLHIPAWVTRPFIERLKQGLGANSTIEVRRARHLEPVKSGVITVTPGGYHIGFKRENGEVLTTLQKGRQGEGCAPSIDRMFKSAASVWGRSLVGVIMTGMGSDGQKGVVDIKRGGGYVIAESRRSSTIFSMPSCAISTGRVDKVLSSGEIGAWISNNGALPAIG